MKRQLLVGQIWKDNRSRMVKILAIHPGGNPVTISTCHPDGSDFYYPNGNPARKCNVASHRFFGGHEAGYFFVKERPAIGHDQLENQREQHIRRFTLLQEGEEYTIDCDGRPFLLFLLADNLPPGFTPRLVRHVMDLLTGRMTTLWDEQAIYGDRERDMEDVRSRATAAAYKAAAERERK